MLSIPEVGKVVKTFSNQGVGFHRPFFKLNICIHLSKFIFNNLKTTFDNGSLGSRNDEERSKMR